MAGCRRLPCGGEPAPAATAARRGQCLRRDSGQRHLLQGTHRLLVGRPWRYGRPSGGVPLLSAEEREAKRSKLPLTLWRDMRRKRVGSGAWIDVPLRCTADTPVGRSARTSLRSAFGPPGSPPVAYANPGTKKKAHPVRGALCCLIGSPDGTVCASTYQGLMAFGPDSGAFLCHTRSS
jgi:hypothetical protein